MKNKTIEELKAEAASLGIKFGPKIGAESLSERIEDFYNNKAVADIVKEKVEDTANEPEENIEKKTPDLAANSREAIAKARQAAMKTRVVRITSNDKRDNDVATVAYLGFENQYFGISKLVPLDVPLELEQALIDIAKTTKITLHKDEIIDGKRTGNKIPVSVKKLNVSYEDVE